MAEKGVIVDDAESGESVACYDAIENDEAANARIVQLTDKTQRKHGFVISTEVGLKRDGLTSSDTTILTTVPAAILTGALTVGDKTTLVVSVRYRAGQGGDDVTITPLVLDSGDAVIGFLAPKIFQSFLPDAGDISDPFHIVDGSDPWNLSEIQAWDVYGAFKIGIHVSYGTSSGAGDGIDVYAEMITGPAVGERAAISPLAGSNSSKTGGGG